MRAATRGHSSDYGNVYMPLSDFFVATEQSSFIMAKFLTNLPCFFKSVLRPPPSRLYIFSIPSHHTALFTVTRRVLSLSPCTFCPCFSCLSNQHLSPKLDFSRAFVNNPQKALRTMKSIFQLSGPNQKCLRLSLHSVCLS